MLSRLSQAHYDTINPLLKSGHLKSAIEGKYHYPHTIVLIPGLSCMFKCTFCGRNYDARFKNSDEKYYQVYKQIIEQDKQRSQINIGGGLEPMTNPHINKIIKLLWENGYRSRMITNAFMLTPKWVDKNPEVHLLDHLRISVYGIDEEEYNRTTRHDKGWSVVKNNLIEYNKRSYKTDVSINYVILPENFLRLHELFNYIDDIGGVRELSLREDFTANQSIKDRKLFKDVLFSFKDEAIKRGIKVDYGYAMKELLEGRDNCKLIQCEYKHLDNLQSPQVKIYVDPKGDIYNYTGASFLDRQGSEKHILGNVWNSSTEQELKKQKKIKPEKEDLKFLDAFAHLIEYYKWSVRNESIVYSTK